MVSALDILGFGQSFERRRATHVSRQSLALLAVEIFQTILKRIACLT